MRAVDPGAKAISEHLNHRMLATILALQEVQAAFSDPDGVEHLLGRQLFEFGRATLEHFPFVEFNINIAYDYSVFMNEDNRNGLLIIYQLQDDVWLSFINLNKICREHNITVSFSGKQVSDPSFDGKVQCENLEIKNTMMQ